MRDGLYVPKEARPAQVMMGGKPYRFARDDGNWWADVAFKIFGELAYHRVIQEADLVLPLEYLK